MPKVKAATALKDVSNITIENEAAEGGRKRRVPAGKLKLSPSKDPSVDTVVMDQKMSKVKATAALKDVWDITAENKTDDSSRQHITATNRKSSPSNDQSTDAIIANQEMTEVKVAAALKDVSNVTSENESGDGSKFRKATKNPTPSPSSDQSLGTLVLDIDDVDDPLSASDYVKDMYKYFRSIELPIPNYMEEQVDATPYNRAILVDWLIEVQKKSSSPSIGVKIEYETLYLIVNVIDRFLGKKQVPLEDLQLIALGALLIGTKYEEMFHFSVPQLVDFCAHAYREEEVLNVQQEILETLEYRLSVPSSSTFLVRFIKAGSKDMTNSISDVTILAKYILDVTLLSFHMGQEFLPSELAAMSVFLARKCFTLRSMKKNWPGPIWSETLWYHTGYSRGKLEQIAIEFMKEKNTVDDWGLKALKKKYDVVPFDVLLRQASNSLNW